MLYDIACIGGLVLIVGSVTTLMLDKRLLAAALVLVGVALGFWGCPDSSFLN
jgi:hypothetical protein